AVITTRYSCSTTAAARIPAARAASTVRSAFDTAHPDPAFTYGHDRRPRDHERAVTIEDHPQDPRAPHVLAVEPEPRAERAPAHEELLHPVRATECGQRRTVPHEADVANVADVVAVLGDDFGGEEITQAHAGLRGSS